MDIAINGLGRIGRTFLRVALEKKLNIVAVNDLADTKTLAYLLKNDSAYGRYSKEIQAGKGFLKINNKKIKVLSQPDPRKLPWKKLKVDFVLESTGLFRKRDDAKKHLKAGAKKILISAPAKNPDVTIVPGVNSNKLEEKHKIISMASCTTNCLAPVAKVLNDKFEILRGFMTTVHGYTSDQAIHDSPHKKLRRGRAAAMNIVPTTSGATTAVSEVIPELYGKLDGLAMRVPVLTGSIVDFVCETGETARVEKINEVLKKASESELKGILGYSEDELVSTDIIGDSRSSVIDALSTQVLGGNLVKILSWYDNEYGYSCRLVDMMKLIERL
ncbi:type I glyceraldehyde-3-phosphate dehydrogenase [Candidatus Pacearchaeota archaeon]|nr:type I glyceraldehyde-3-phosphate dehydrogenase [Candidatus Pacearchaeota archaeon]MBD3282724.1 type I glyceraldehyde-3-phosphate dehydrogenase [Candidatus Pacearchaeota archaeon]